MCSPLPPSLRSLTGARGTPDLCPVGRDYTPGEGLRSRYRGRGRGRRVTGPGWNKPLPQKRLY